MNKEKYLKLHTHIYMGEYKLIYETKKNIEKRENEVFICTNKTNMCFYFVSVVV